MDNFINKLFNLIIRIYEIWQSGKAGKISSIFIASGLILVSSGGFFTFRYSDMERDISVSSDSGNPDYILYALGIIFLLIGASILIHTYRKISAEKVLIYFANTLKLGNSKTPSYAMEKNDRVNIVERYLDTINSYDKNEVINDYRFNLKLFMNRIEHKDIQKVYIAALGSTPYLYLIGTLIRNGHIKNEVLDYNRDKDKWYRLESIGDKLTHCLMNEVTEKTIYEKLEELCGSEFSSIGIAISYSYEIHKSSVPEEFEEQTLYLTHSLGFGNDKLSDKLSQSSLLNELSVYIDKLKAANKQVHLFVSAQASVCINLGKRYQDNTMGEICIYNFNGADRIYDWYIAFNKDNVS